MLDFDFGDLFSHIGNSLMDFGKDIISDIDLKDVAAIATVGSGIYFANKQLKAQEKAIAAQAAAAANVSTPTSLTSADAGQEEDYSPSIVIGEAAPETEQDFYDDANEKRTNTGRIELDSDLTTPKKKKLKLTSKLGSSIPQIGLKL